MYDGRRFLLTDDERRCHVPKLRVRSKDEQISSGSDFPRLSQMAIIILVYCLGRYAFHEALPCLE